MYDLSLFALLTIPFLVIKDNVSALPVLLSIEPYTFKVYANTFKLF